MAGEEKFVIVGTMVDDHVQGTVVTREQLQVKDKGGELVHDATERLLKLGAIRKASGDEAGLDKVPLPQLGLSTAAQLRLAAQDAEIDQLTRAVASLEERAAFHRSVNPPTPPPPGSPEEDPAVALAAAQRQQKIDGLKFRMEALQKEVAGAAAPGKQSTPPAHHPAPVPKKRPE